MSITGCPSVNSQANRNARLTRATTAGVAMIGRIEPILLVAVVQHELQAADADQKQDQPHRIDGQLDFFDSRAAAASSWRRRRKAPTGRLM